MSKMELSCHKHLMKGKAVEKPRFFCVESLFPLGFTFYNQRCAVLEETDGLNIHLNLLPTVVSPVSAC